MQVAFVCLGRFGDILNALPLAHDYHVSSGQIPGFVISREFAPLLDSVSYVQPLVYDGPFHSPETAAAHFRRTHPHCEFRRAQMYSATHHKRPQCWGFLRDAWALTNTPHAWGRLPLVFDRRDARAEEELLQRAGVGSRPYVLVAAGGYSSPFRHGGLLTKKLSEILDSEGLDVLNISDLRANRFQDLLGLFDRAQCVVSSDTGHLHLAHASPVPVVSLITDGPTPWHRSSWRPAHVGRFLYSEVVSKIDEIASIISGQSPRPKLVHVWSDFIPPEGRTRHRILIAQQSWRQESIHTQRWERCPVRDGELPRSSRTVLGDNRAMPFIRDLIAKAREKCAPHDIIVLSNSDVGLTPGITGEILHNVRTSGSTWCYRWDFNRIDAPIHTEALVGTGVWYPGSDLFAFSAQWWDAHGHEFPDMVLGCEFWDCVFRQLCKMTGGVEIHKGIWHEKHNSYWEQPQHRKSNKGNIHNAGLANRWFSQHGTTMHD